MPPAGRTTHCSPIFEATSELRSRLAHGTADRQLATDAKAVDDQDRCHFLARPLAGKEVGERFPVVDRHRGDRIHLPLHRATQASMHGRVAELEDLGDRRDVPERRHVMPVEERAHAARRERRHVTLRGRIVNGLIGMTGHRRG